jgi:hypothetical protein
MSWMKKRFTEDDDDDDDDYDNTFFINIRVYKIEMQRYPSQRSFQFYKQRSMIHLQNTFFKINRNRK